MSKQLIKFDATVKSSLDALFEQEPSMTVEDVTNLFKTKWTYVNESVGSVPEGSYTGYADVMEFMMSEGVLEYPESYYPDYYIPQATAEALVNYYKKFDGRHSTVEQLIRYLYSNDVLEFSNIRNPELKEISKKYVPRKIVKNIGMKLFKPRYYGIKDDEIGYHGSESILTLICQPDRRKNLFITLTRDTNSWGNILVLTPWKAVIGY